MKCPKCGSEHVQFATKTSGGGISFLDSCCGYILLGPLGLLCGAVGSGTRTDEYWTCHDCGHKFSTGQGKEKIRNDQQAKDRYIQDKGELDSLSEDERNPETVRARYQAAISESNMAKGNYKQLLRDLSAGEDRQARKYARRIRGAVYYKILGITILLGIVMLVSVPPLGICLLAIGILLGAVYEIRQKHAKNYLLQSCPDFKAALDAKKHAEAQVNYYQALEKKVASVKSYEESHREP